MDLQKKLNEDLKTALKSKDQFRLGVLRLVNSSLHNKQIEKGKDAVLSEDDVLRVLAKEGKKRKESIEAFEKGERPELAENEKKELAIIGEYLPEQMGKKEIFSAVEKILAGISDKILRQGSGQGNFGLVMKEVMKELKGKADAKVISEVIKEKLG